MRIGVVVVTHCRLGEELIGAAQLVLGEELRQFQAVSIDPKEGSEEIREKIIGAIRKVDGGQGILILTDLFGGTASNLSFAFRQPGKVDVVTGVNLPMVIKFTNLRGIERLEEVAAKIRDEGRKAIYAASEVLKKDADKGAA